MSKERILPILIITILAVMMITVTQKTRMSSKTYDVLLIICIVMFALVIFCAIIKLIKK